MEKFKKFVLKNKWIIAIVLVVLIVAVPIVKNKMTGKVEYESATVTQKNLDIYYTFTGSVEKAGTVSSTTSGFDMSDIMSGNIDMSGIMGSFGTGSNSSGTASASASTADIAKGVVEGVFDGMMSVVGEYIPFLAPDEKADDTTNDTTTDDTQEPTNHQVTVKIDEYNLGCLQVGSTVDVSIVALNKNITGTIKSISETAQNQQGVAYFSAIIELPIDPDVKIGMTTETKILNQSAQNVMTVPMNALQFDDEKKPYVLVKDGKDYVETYVEVGLSNGTDAEIKSGLTADQVIYYQEKVSNPMEGFQPPMM